MKRIVLMALVLCLCLSCLAGCGGSGSETTEAPATQAPAATESGSDATEAPAAEETEAPEDASLYPLEEAVTLSVLGPIYAPRSAGVIETWDEAPFYAAASEATNIYLEFSCVSTEAYNNQFNIVVASGDMPDMFWQGLRQYSGGADAAIDEGIFVNLADYLDYAPDYVSALETYGYTSNVTTDSGNMAAFYAIGKNESRPLMGFVIRQDWLDELSLEAPVTYDDYYNVLTAFKTEYNIPEPITMGYMGAVCGDWLCAGFDVSLFSHTIIEYGNKGFYQVDGEVKFGFLEDGFIDYVNLMAQWYSEGLMSQDFAVENENPTDSEYMGKITNGEVGIGFIDASYIDTLEETGGFDLEPIQDAVQNAGDVTHLSSCKDKEMEDTYVITTACENIEAAMLWNNYWYTEEGSMLANWGIEGETYTIENGEPAFTDLLLNNPDGLTLSQTTYIYIGKLGVYDSDRDQAMYSDQVNSVAGVWATNKDNAYKIPQGVTMTAEESEDYNNIFSDINTYVQENLVKFIVGDLPLSDLESFVDELYALDIETCIGYWQAALDRFNAR